MADFVPLDPSYLDAVKKTEGFAPTASWDYKQYTNGYGTKALYPGETIGRDEAQRRYDAAMNVAARHVDSVAPNAPPGVRAALASLTFNAGPGWASSGLGDLVRAGDWQGARDRFLQYNKAGGQTNDGLVARRQREASWFDPTATASAQPTATQQTTPSPPAPAPQQAAAAQPTNQMPAYNWSRPNMQPAQQAPAQQAPAQQAPAQQPDVTNARYVQMAMNQAAPPQAPPPQAMPAYNPLYQQYLQQILQNAPPSVRGLLFKG